MISFVDNIMDRRDLSAFKQYRDNTMKSKQDFTSLQNIEDNSEKKKKNHYRCTVPMPRQSSGFAYTYHRRFELSNDDLFRIGI